MESTLNIQICAIQSRRNPFLTGLQEVLKIKPEVNASVLKKENHFENYVSCIDDGCF